MYNYYMNTIEVLYFDGCPSWKPALENLKKVTEAEKISSEIVFVKIISIDQAQKEHFLGSPSFRVNGIDLWPEERDNYGLSCRVYKTPAGFKGFPTFKMLKEEIRSVLVK